MVTHGLPFREYVSPPKIHDCVQKSTVRCPFAVLGQYVTELVGGSNVIDGNLAVGDKIFQGKKSDGQMLALVSVVGVGGKVESSLRIGEDGWRLNR